MKWGYGRVLPIPLLRRTWLSAVAFESPGPTLPQCRQMTTIVQDTTTKAVLKNAELRNL